MRSRIYRVTGALMGAIEYQLANRPDCRPHYNEINSERDDDSPYCWRIWGLLKGGRLTIELFVPAVLGGETRMTITAGRMQTNLQSADVQGANDRLPVLMQLVVDLFPQILLSNGGLKPYLAAALRVAARQE